MVDDGIVGVTSNPTIFQKAIADSSDYDEAIHALHGSGKSAADVFFELAIEDVQEAADQIRGVYDSTDHLDGFVSFELPPAMANDTAKSDRRARRSSGGGSTGPTSSSRSPAPPRACPPSRSRSSPASTSTSRCSSRWPPTTPSTRRSSAASSGGSRPGLPIDDVHSVASFFVSRVDTAVDNQLPEGSPLRGRAAVANAKLAYQHFLATIAGDRWQALAAKGAKVQRPLWASTGTKNAAYSDVLYVDSLIGPDTRQHDARGHHRGVLRPRHGGAHGRCRRRRRARPSSTRIAAAGVDLDAVTKQLELDGVKSFSDSFDSLLGDGPGAARQPYPRRRMSIAERSLENPLRAGLRVGGATVPAAFVIFGATGDLAQRKLLPAIYNLGRAGCCRPALRWSGTPAPT